MKRVMFLLAFCICPALSAQQPQAHYFTPAPGKGQLLLGAAAAEQGAVGFDATKIEGRFVVELILPGSPAQNAGLRVGDAVTAIDGKPVADLQQLDFYEALKKKPGETLSLAYVRGAQNLGVNLPVQSRAKVYPDEAKLPAAVNQVLFDGRAGVIASLAQAHPQYVTLWLYFGNKSAAMVAVDDAKFFILDGQGQQLRRLTLDEIRYSVQLYLAQNMRSGRYAPPPPPPQRRYTITGTESGNYTISDLGGGFGRISGTSSGTYTVAPEPDYGQLGYSLGLAIRQWRDRKHDQKLLQETQRVLSQLESNYFNAQSAIIPGENRMGGITFYSSRAISGPLRVVLFLTNPETKKEESVTFDFR